MLEKISIDECIEFVKQWYSMEFTPLRNILIVNKIENF